MVLAAILVACGDQDRATDGSDQGATDGGADGIVVPGADGPPPVPLPDEHESATGCQGVYNPDQLLEYRITMAPGDWTALKADTTNSVTFNAQFQCGEEPALTVGIRRKRSGGVEKPGMKVDVNYFADQTFHDLRKLSFENGASSGSDAESERGELVREYTAWRIMRRTGGISGRAAFARVVVNGASLGVYVNVEHPDKRFLRTHFGHDEGWLFKKSGGDDDGYKTNEGLANPYEDRVCFWDTNPCATPSAAELEALLPTVLDIDQMLRFAAGNAFIGNADGPLGKDNNFYFYDWGGPRIYFAWDLDTTQRETPAIFGAPGEQKFTSVLFTHWEDAYDQLLTDLLAGDLRLAEIESELDRAASVAGAALDADPFATGDDTSSIAAELTSWWAARHTQVSSELAAH